MTNELLNLVNWAKRIPAFTELSEQDQVSVFYLMFIKKCYLFSLNIAF